MKATDLTQGKILSKLLYVALPIMGASLMQMTYNLVDMFWLGRLGAGAVAASGTAGMYLWLSQAFLFIGRMGAEIGVSQNLGAGNVKEARRYGEHGFFLALVLGAFITVAYIALRGPLVGFFGIEEAAVVADAELYLAITSTAMIATFGASALGGICNGSGDSRTPFFVSSIGIVLNVILDPLLIFTFDMGMAGAAVATAFSQMVVFVICLFLPRFIKLEVFQGFRFLIKPKIDYIKQIFRWSLPIALESLLFTLMSMITSRFVASFGSNAMAVSRVGSQVESLSWLIGGGFGSALTAFVGQNYGAKRMDRIRSGFKISLGIMLIWGVIVIALLYFGASFLVWLFLPDPDVIGMGVRYLHIMLLCQIPQCLESVAGGSFKGMGKTTPPSLVSIISNATRVILAWLLMQTSLGLEGIWWAMAIAGTLRGLWLLAWYLLMQSRTFPKADAA